MHFPCVVIVENRAFPHACFSFCVWGSFRTYSLKGKAAGAIDHTEGDWTAITRSPPSSSGSTDLDLSPHPLVTDLPSTFGSCRPAVYAPPLGGSTHRVGERGLFSHHAIRTRRGCGRVRRPWEQGFLLHGLRFLRSERRFPGTSPAEPPSRSWSIPTTSRLLYQRGRLSPTVPERGTLRRWSFSMYSFHRLVITPSPFVSGH
jgi:hypothetical protein